MKEILNTLREQHQKILSLLNQAELVEELIHYVETVHHPLEEQVLFPLLEKQPCLRQGGPRCTYFMGLRLEADPLTNVRIHLQNFYQASGYKSPAYPVASWLTPQSPLSIPYEEHVVGAELAHSILYMLKGPQGDLHKKHFQILFKDYCDLLKMHIDKEDNCLFIMCNKAIV